MVCQNQLLGSMVFREPIIEIGRCTRRSWCNPTIMLVFPGHGGMDRIVSEPQAIHRVVGIGPSAADVVTRVKIFYVDLHALLA